MTERRQLWRRRSALGAIGATVFLLGLIAAGNRWGRAAPADAPGEVRTLAASQGTVAQRQDTVRPQRPVATTASCDRCHGELEFLRQHVDSLGGARRLEVTQATIAVSAHREMTCGECHEGFARYPHPSGGRTATCQSCHEKADTLWRAGAHADTSAENPALCTSCHGTHDVKSADELKAHAGITAMNGRCVACHDAVQLPRDDPHADSVGCASCHGAHDVQPVDSRTGALARAEQGKTCGACHDTVFATWRTDDIHATALVKGLSERAKNDKNLAKKQAPTCTSCHGGHGMPDTASLAFSKHMVTQCTDCHAGYGTTFRDAYHGKAALLGSKSAAECADCHTSHSILPASDPRSTVGEAKVLETCRGCHPRAEAGFTKYNSHPNPRDRERNPALYYAFFFMNTLLVGVLVVFGAHTFLWWVRLLIDRRKGGGHGQGGHP